MILIPVFKRARAGWRAALVVAFLAWSPPRVVAAGPAESQDARDHATEAAFLANLATFVEWPSHAFATPDEPFIIGILGEDPFGKVLDDLLADEYVGKRRIAAQRLAPGDDITRCHVLFLTGSDARVVKGALRRVQGRPVLTVGRAAGFIQSGGMVVFSQSDTQVSLFVNTEAMRAVGLRPSSKLLEVARVVDGTENPP